MPILSQTTQLSDPIWGLNDLFMAVFKTSKRKRKIVFTLFQQNPFVRLSNPKQAILTSFFGIEWKGKEPAPANSGSLTIMGWQPERTMVFAVDKWRNNHYF